MVRKRVSGGARRVVGAALFAGACCVLTDAAAAERCNRTQYRIVIDVGHTAAAPGAKSARGVREYQFNLTLAKAIGAALSAAGYAKSFLLITQGANALPGRSARANRIGADLFLSVHHDSVEDASLRPWTDHERVHMFSDKYRGYAIFVSRLNAQAAASERFARALGAELRTRDLSFSTHATEDIEGERHEVLDPERGVFRYDGLAVLKSTKAPAVLLEAGSIVNRAEELELAKPQRQHRIAESVVGAVDAFFCRP